MKSRLSLKLFAFAWRGGIVEASLLSVALLVACGPKAASELTEAPGRPGNLNKQTARSESVAKNGERSQHTECESVLNLGDVFNRHRVHGVFVLRDEQNGCVATSDQGLANTPFRPQSTFKIPNALIGLETGLISGPDYVWVWDKQPQRNPLWEQDLNLKQALNVSCVPCFRSLARDIGVDRMRKFLREMKYGNQDISGPIDLFWLTGGLRITPVEQTLFVHKSLQGELPIKKAHIDRVWADLEQEPEGDLRVFAKTGLGEQDGLAIGWVVGYLQKGPRRWSFATFVQTPNGEEPSVGMPRLMPLRMAITREIVSRLKLANPA